jgi:glycosyltransferase involved in cell wall biosynthesis
VGLLAKLSIVDADSNMFQRAILPRSDRGPLRVMFLTTTLNVGGMETLLVNLVRRFDRERFLPELCCLKRRGTLGEELAAEIPVHADLIRGKFDVTVLWRLARLMRRRRIDAVITVGTGGDKMFWGRLAAWWAGVPVVASALHSTGLPDRVEPINRLLAPWTDAFIAVAEAHGRYIAAHEGCPAAKVRVIPNGVDVGRFRPRPARDDLRAELNLPPGTPTVAIVAALRPEKQHELFLRVAARTQKRVPGARFLIVGDGPRRQELEALSASLGLDTAAIFLGTRPDVADLLALTDVVVLTSKMEANPVSILEAMAAELPVVAPCVGSIPESVADGVTGYLVPPGHEVDLSRRIAELLTDRDRAQSMGRAGRVKAVALHSLDTMVDGYQNLIDEIYDRKAQRRAPRVRRPGKAAVGR